MQENSTETTLLDSKSLLKSTIYSAGSKYLKQSRDLLSPTIPKAANWGWSHLPWPAKLMIGGVLCGVISVTTPYWVILRFDSYGQATFGLFHYCNGEMCTSIHDNLIESRSVDAWYHLVQGNMCIGVACSIVSLGVMTNNLEGKYMRMSPTTLVATIAILAISALEQFFAQLIFISYVDDTDFLFDRQRIYSLDFYGSFYIGVMSTVCSLICVFMVLLNNQSYKGGAVKNKCVVSDEKLVELYNDFLVKQHQQYYQNNGYYNYGDDNDVGLAGIKGPLRHRSRNDDDEGEIAKKRVFEEDLYGDDDYDDNSDDDYDPIDGEDDDDDDDDNLIPEEDEEDDDEYINDGFDEDDEDDDEDDKKLID